MTNKLTRHELITMHTQSGRAWDEAATKYERELEDAVVALAAGTANLLNIEIHHLQDILSHGGNVLHVQCAAGTDTLSLLQMGATSVTGTDISPNMLAVAEEKATRLELVAEWVLADTAALPTNLHNTFDLVYTGRGALCWNLDIDVWATNVAACVRPGGVLFILEGHPLDWVWDQNAAMFVIDPAFGGYFSTAIDTDTGCSTQFISDRVSPATDWSTKHERQWTLGQIVTAVASQGLVVEHLSEHPEYYWNAHPLLSAEDKAMLPHTFILIARKPIA